MKLDSELELELELELEISGGGGGLGFLLFLNWLPPVGLGVTGDFDGADCDRVFVILFLVVPGYLKHFLFVFHFESDTVKKFIHG